MSDVISFFLGGVAAADGQLLGLLIRLITQGSCTAKGTPLWIATAV